MGNTKDTDDKLERERYQVNDAEIVVNGAVIVCSRAGKSNRINYLSVIDGHGILQGGDNCAHDESCIPMENIMPFSNCASTDAKKALTALAAKATGQTKLRYDTAISIIEQNEKSYGCSPVPCTLPLLDRWFDADEREIVTESMAADTRIKQKVRDIQTKLTEALKLGANDLYATYMLVIYTDKELTLEEKVDYANRSGQLKEIKKNITELCNSILNAINTDIQINGTEFQDTVRQLRQARDNLNKILSAWEEAYSIYANLKGYETEKSSIEDLIEELNDKIGGINGWKEKEYHLITTDSFLVCRCGGIITISESGQDFGKVVDILVANILTAVTEFREHCQTGMADYCIKEMDEWDHKWSSYKMAAEGLQHFEKMLLGPQESEIETESCIYLELLCHSYNDEVSKTMMAALSLLSLYSNTLTFLLAFYTLATMEETAQGAADGISANISALEAVADGDGGAITKLGGAAIVRYNNLYTIASNLVNFLYVSHDTWVESVRITVFTDSHAHICERKLTKEGEMFAWDYYQMWTKADYIAGDLGRGIKWKEDPGLYMRSLIHKGENRNAMESKVESNQKLEENIPKS